MVAARCVSRAEIIEQVLVKVNGDILTKTDFEQRQVRRCVPRMQSQALTSGG